MLIKRTVIAVLNDLGLFEKTEFIYLYSSVSKGTTNPLSDIDICVSINLPPISRLKAQIKLQGHLSEGYDITIFEDLPLYLQPEVLKGKLLYCKNRKKVVERAFQVIRDFEDFQKIYEYYIARDKSKVEI